MFCKAVLDFFDGGLFFIELGSYKYTEPLFLCIFKPVLDYTLTSLRTDDGL